MLHAVVIRVVAAYIPGERVSCSHKEVGFRGRFHGLSSETNVCKIGFGRFAESTENEFTC